MEDAAAGFPATLVIDYPDRELGRLTTFLRPFTGIPIAIVLGLVTRATVRAESAKYVVGSGGIVFLATVLKLLFRQKYPRWWWATQDRGGSPTRAHQQKNWLTQWPSHFGRRLR